MPSSRIISKSQALKNKNDRELQAYRKDRQTIQGRKSIMGETLDFFVGGAARAVGDVVSGTIDRSRKNLKDIEQFASKAAKTVIEDRQGQAKMTMRGFGN
jgi:hypothetical protein